MNEITVHEMVLGLDFLLIHESLTDNFQIGVLRGYEEMAKAYSIVKLNDTFVGIEGDFSEIYCETHDLIVESWLRRHRLSEEWDKFTQEDYTEAEEEVAGFPTNVEERDYFRDVRTVLDAYHLFYVETEKTYSRETGQVVEHITVVHNSPLQEVW